MHDRGVEYEWDRAKAEANLRKHDVDFADAIGALEDALGLTLVDEAADEQRFVTVGTDVLGRILVVVHAPRGDGRTRIISARKATPRERRSYEGES